MELLMFAIAGLAYVLFTGRIPGLSPTAKKITEDGAEPEEEKVARELQLHAAAGDHRAVLKLWQRLKSFERAPEVDLLCVVKSLRALGKSDGEVVSELRSALECNANLGKGARDLMDELRRQGSVDLLGKLVTMLKGRGIAIDAQVVSTAAASTVKRSSNDNAVNTADSDGAVDLNKVISKIRSCGRERDLREAVRVFTQLKQSGVQMNPMVYNCLIDACVQCGDVRAALGYFEQMKQLDLVDVVSYNTMVKAYLAWGQVEEAQGLLQEMSRRGFPPNKVTYNELLNARVVANDRRGMWSLIEDMQASGVAPSSATCSILLKSLTSNSLGSDVARTMALLERMEEPMDEVLFASVIEACIRIRQLEQLWSWVQRYMTQGGMQALTAPTYGSMIKAYGQSGNVERVWALWREMRERGVAPTSITVGCTVDALVKNGQVEDAWSLVHELLGDETRQQYVNTVIYSTILKGFATSRQTGRILAVHAEMRERGVQCNTITYNTMINACAGCGNMDRVPALLEEMKLNHVEPDIITYSTIVKGYCLSGDVDRGFEVLQEMRKDGKYAPDEILYNSLLDGCAKQHRVEEALRLLEDMRASGAAPSNYTVSILVKLLGRARRLNQAFAIVEEMCSAHGLRANVHVYTCLVQACFQNRQAERALAVHDAMVSEAGCQPDQKFYSSLARGCAQAGALGKAAAVIRCAHHLPGHDMATSKGAPHGVEAKVLEEVVMKLNAGGRAERELARGLLSDLRGGGYAGVQDSVYAKVAKDVSAHEGAPWRRQR